MNLSWCSKWCNYVVVFVVGAIIYSGYWTSDYIGHSDAEQHIPSMKICWEASRAFCIPTWMMTTTKANGNWWVAPIPQISPTMLLAPFMNFVPWLKLHVFLFLVFGAFGVVAYTRHHGASGLWPAVAGIMAMFSGTQLEHSVYSTNYWVTLVGIIPWCMLVVDTKNWRAIPWLTLFLFVSGPLHCAIFVPGTVALYSFVYGWRTFVTYLRYMLLGVAMSLCFILPVVMHNYGNTIGRGENWICIGWPDFRHFISCTMTHWYIAPFWPYYQETAGAIVLQFMYYSYFGPVAAACMLIGGALIAWKKHKQAYCCFVLSTIILLCCSGSVWKMLSHVPLISHLVYINKTPTRMMMVFMILAPCIVAVGMSFLRYKWWISSIVLLFLATDYALLCREMANRKLTFDTKYANSCNDIPRINAYNVNVRPFLMVPGDSIYMLTEGFNAKIQMATMTNAFTKYLCLENLVTGEKLRCNSSNEFYLPNRAGTTTYVLKFKDPCWYYGKWISIVSIILFMVFPYRKNVAQMFHKCYNKS